MKTIHLFLFLMAGLVVDNSLAAVPPPSPIFPGSSEPRKPNIIFILADDLGYGDLGCYGQKKVQTPNIDRLAAEGIRFTQCYAGSPACAPSRAALMTGMHTGHARIRGNASVPLLVEDVTVAEVLKVGGYRTCVLGKWGLGLAGSTGTPNKQGFDEWLGYLSQTHAQDYYPTQLYRNDRIHTLDLNREGAKGTYSHDLFAKVAANYVSLNRDFPFFLYLAYTIPHANLGLKDNGMEVPSEAPYSNEGWPQPEKNKAAMITRLDADIGNLLYRLRELKIDTNTIVFLSSDNGPHRQGGTNPQFFQSAGPFRGIEGDLYEGGIRVPMIVRWPGRVPAGAVSDQAWAFWDFLPTAADIAGVKQVKNIDGISVLPVLLGRQQTNQHEFLYWESHENGSRQAVRMGDWKALRLAPGKPVELYNLRADPGEKEDVAVRNPEIVAKIETYLKTARTESQLWPLAGVEEKAKERKNPAPEPD